VLFRTSACSTVGILQEAPPPEQCPMSFLKCKLWQAVKDAERPAVKLCWHCGVTYTSACFLSLLCVCMNMCGCVCGVFDCLGGVGGGQQVFLKPNSALINGIGQSRSCGNRCKYAMVRGAVSSCSNPRLRLRIINSGGGTIFNVSVDDHRLIVVAADGVSYQGFEVCSSSSSSSSSLSSDRSQLDTWCLTVLHSIYGLRMHACCW